MENAPQKLFAPPTRRGSFLEGGHGQRSSARLR